MSKYPLEMLIGIRDRRYQDALSKVSELELQLKNTVLKKEQKIKELEDYRIWKDEETDRRFAKIMYTVNKRAFYTKFNEEIISLNYKETKIQEEILEIEQLIKKLQEDVVKAKQHAKEAHKSLQKLENHKEIWLVEEHRIEEYKADIELEDFTSKKSV